MSFEVGAEVYGRFMGRYSEQLALRYLELLDPSPGQRALDVGCGPGALTAALVDRLGAGAVTAVDPSQSFVEAARTRFPEVVIEQASAEQLPFPDGTFDLAVAQLVVHFMTDPVAGIAELGRVTRPGGLISACVWDHGAGRGPLSTFWRAVTELDPSAPDESDLPGAREGHLLELFEAAGLADVRPAQLSVRSVFADFAEWWQPYTFGIGPAGEYVANLDADQRQRLADRCAQLLPPAPFTIEAMAWTAIGRA
ncbi:MAG: class I SAM-dependent methyltransferase [Jatrophihabitantaceae bacterium]